MNDLENLLVDVRELPSGYEFRYSADRSSWLSVATFVDLERLCCPFFDFRAGVDGRDGGVRLRITGSQSAKMLLWSHLSGR